MLGRVLDGLRDRLRRRAPLTAAFVDLGSPFSTDITARSGFDVVVIDLEHGAGGEAALAAQLLAAERHAFVVVRVAGSAMQAGWALDLGAGGILYPRIASAAEAAEMAAGTRYAEARGVSGLVRAAGYGDTGAGWKERADASVGCIVQIERASALAGVDEIAALDAVDAVLVGPNDLANDLGCEPVLSDPRLQDALRAVAAAAERHGKTAGLYLPDVRGAREWYREGFNLLSASFDSKLLRDASTAVASLLRTAVEP